MKINGPINPNIGTNAEYCLMASRGDVPLKEGEEPLFELFQKRRNGKFMKMNLLRNGIATYIFGQITADQSFKVVAYNSKTKAKLAELDVVPQTGDVQKILSVTLRHTNNEQPKRFSLFDKLEAVANTTNLQKRTLIFELYQGNEESPDLKPLSTEEGIVLADGTSTVIFDLAKTLFKASMNNPDDEGDAQFHVKVRRKHAKKEVTARRREPVNNI